jgi:uncharacterized protein YuzE
VITTNYDPEADVMRIGFGREGVAYDGAQEIAPEVYVDFDKDGQPIGAEIISIRWRSEQARVVRPAAE